MDRGPRPPMVSRRAWREIGEALARHQALQPVVEALKAEDALEKKARLRAADELDALGEPEAAALLRR